jgi:regulator of replication initiation timing
MPNHNRNSRRAVVHARHVVSEPDPVVVVAQAMTDMGLENTNNQLRGRIKSLEKDIKAIKKTLTNQERAQEKLQFENNKLKDDLKHEHEKTIVIKSKVINNRIEGIMKEGIGLGYITGVRDDRIIWKTIYDKQGKDLTLDQLGEELFKMDAELTTMKKGFTKALEDLKYRNEQHNQYRDTIRGFAQLFPKEVVILEDGNKPNRPEAFGYSVELTGLAKQSPTFFDKFVENHNENLKQLRAENEQLKKQIKEDDLLFQDVNQ